MHNTMHISEIPALMWELQAVEIPYMLDFGEGGSRGHSSCRDDSADVVIPESDAGRPPWRDLEMPATGLNRSHATRRTTCPRRVDTSVE
jgi:hypothetical protein